jgi:membrane protease YdiL (CAAX protease family)
MNARRFAAQHPVLTYLVVTLAISWGSVLLIIGRSFGTTGLKAQDNPLFPMAVLAMLAGPSVTGVILTALVDGGRGLREFRCRLLEWRMDGRWYGLALLSAPLLATAVALALTLESSEFLPTIFVADDKTAILRVGLLVGLAAGFFEELGWTGFAVPRLRRRHGVIATGVIVGLVWSAWHIPVVIWGIGDRGGTMPLALFVTVDGLSVLPAFRVLMVWVYDRTESLFIAMLMHASLSFTALVVAPTVTGSALLTYDLTFTVAALIVLALLVTARTADWKPAFGRRAG